MSKRQVNESNKTGFSKYLSFILRHHPESIGLNIEDEGWINTQELINAINTHEDSKYIISLEMLEEIVREDSKQRYSFKSDKSMIRANQGHSIKNLDMKFVELTESEIPKELYHGTSESNLIKIQETGKIISVTRQYVHLSYDIETAKIVGKRHGKPVIIVIDIEQAYKDGLKIYKSENNVYLTSEIDAKYFKKIIE